MIYEIRVYEAAEGKADAMRRRFMDIVAVKFFPRHGISCVKRLMAQGATLSGISALAGYRLALDQPSRE